MSPIIKAEAARRMKDAYDADKNTLRLVDSYARFLAHRGDTAQAIQIYQAFDQILPSHPIVIAALADLKAGKPLELPVKNAEQGAAEVLYGLGAAGGRQGDELAAMIYLRLSLYLDPDNSLAIITLADIYERIKQTEQAIDVYALVPDKDPLRTTADIQTGLILETLGRSDESAAFLKRVVSDHPDDGEALAALGNLQRSHKQYAGCDRDLHEGDRQAVREDQLGALLFPRHLLRAQQAMAAGRGRFQEGAGDLPGPAAGPELSRL